MMSGDISKTQKIDELKKELVLIFVNLVLVLKGRKLTAFALSLILESLFLATSVFHSSPSISILISSELTTLYDLRIQNKKIIFLGLYIYLGLKVQLCINP